ncbi:MAG: hypothetical protein V1708_04980 [Candidatus Micrarchaeota archaeon]
MAFSSRLFIVIAFGLASALSFSGCIAPVGPGPSPSPTLNPAASAIPTPQVLYTRYAEVVFDDPACASGYCFEEYMLFGDGKILKKFVSNDKPNAVQAEIRQASPQKANDLLEWVDAGWHEAEAVLEWADSGRAGQDIGCKGCAQYHAIYYGGERARRIAMVSSIASQFAKDFMSKAKELFGGSTPAETFYAQLFYKKTGANLVDYHFFADGTVVHEQFDGQDNLLSARVLRVDGGIVRSAVSGGKESGNNFAECLKQHYEYSYLDLILAEVSTTGLLTCGSGGSSADLAFRTLRAMVEA